MKKETIFYEAPTAQTFVVRLEGRLLTGSDQSQVSANFLNRGGGYGDGDDSYYDYD